MRAYLCGAIDHAGQGGVEWRDKITPLLEKMGVIVLNPLNKPIPGHLEDQQSRNVRRENQLKGDFDSVIAESETRLVDLRMVDISDFIVCYLDMEQRPFGTIEEIVTANREKKAILVWTAQGKKSTSPWLFWMLKSTETIFDTFQEMVDYLEGINNGTVEPGKRWVFFRL